MHKRSTPPGPPHRPDADVLSSSLPRGAPSAAGTHVHEIGADGARRIMSAAEAAGVTLAVVLCAAFARLFGTLGGESEILMDVPAALGACGFRPGAARRAVTMALSSAANGRDFIAQVSNALLSAASTPSALVPGKSAKAIRFDFSGEAGGPAAAADPPAAPPCDVSLHVTEKPDRLRLELTYATDALTPDTAARWCGHYETLLDGLAADPDAPLAELPLLTPDEAAALARLGNDTDAGLPPAVRFETLIDDLVAVMPDAVAIEDDAGSMTYAELARASDRLAAHIQRALPEPGGRVAVLLERSAGLPVGLLAVLKAGHAFVPLDPTHPTARLRSILENADVQGILHTGGFPEAAQGLSAIPIRADVELPNRVPAPVHVHNPTAYVIFTSGSTGAPKGVEIPHRAVVNFLNSMAVTPGFTARDTLLAVTTVCFDIAVLELFLPLITGGKVVISSARSVHLAFSVVERLGQGDITVLQGTPSLFRMLLEARWRAPRGLKLLIGGEPLPRDLADRLLADGAEVWNMYGPTETTVWSSCGRVGDGPIDIGRPIANTTLHVLDTADRIAPIGVPGELNIGGDGLAKGYFGRPDLTQAAFRHVDLPGLGRRRLYATGDLAVRNADGSIQVLGRRDGQVKLRGFRIELGDVEAAIRQVPSVRAAAADLRPGPLGPMLVGYVVPADGAEPSPAELTATVSRAVPAYMVPARWTTLEALPLTMNGKLDRRALP